MTDLSFINTDPEIQEHLLEDDGTFPNHATLPLLFYRRALKIITGQAARQVEEVFRANQWGNAWRNGVYPYHHYHSTAHEVLGMYQGEARLQLGGPDGVTLEVMAGDVLIIPAGVAHKNLGASDDFACVGAYPPGQRFDMNYGKAGERPRADQNIARVPLPATDPVYGNRGFLTWIR